MKSNKRVFVVTLLCLVTLTLGCSSNNGNSPAPPDLTAGLPNGPVLPPLSGPNVLPITVNGSTCAANSYSNKPCVSVTICSPVTSQCQTISDILVDTGSYGLRVFGSVLNSNITLTPEHVGNNTLTECAQFGDGSSEWGPVSVANVILGGESPVQVPIQVIDSSFVGESANCNGSDASPSAAGFNGILGVGFFAQDCGAECENTSGNGMYFSCNSTSCSGTTASLLAQLQNPVGFLGQDNNGVVVELPSVALGGVVSVDGYLVLGIGTQSDNVPSGVSGYSTDANGFFSTMFNGQNYTTSFLDSGSNGLFFTSPNSSTLPDCGNTDSNYAGLFCPASTQTFSGVTTANSGSPSISIPFQIGNAISLIGNTPNYVFVELGGDGGGDFDWGLPFFLGRNIYVGLENTSSSLGSGTYWGY